MGVRQTRLPSIPEPNPDNILEVCVALKEVVEVGVLGVKRGDPLDSNVTYRNLYNFGYYGSNTGGAGGSNTTPPIVKPPTGGPFLPPVNIPTDLPGRPTNVKTHPVWDAIQVTWDWPIQPNTHWERAAVHASTTKTFNDGNIVGYTSMNFYIHTGVGLSDPAGDGGEYEPGVRYYWVRFEATDLITGELKATEWSPYNYNDGVMGVTATDITATIENFRLGSSVYPELEAISPFVVGTITEYDENGVATQVPAVGLDGNFLVDGTITARAIQAKSIGATEIRAESIWTGLMESYKVVTNQLKTSEGYEFRLEINGQGSGLGFYPLWYGNGETGGEGSLFYIRNYDVYDGEDIYKVSSLFLSGEMYVTGIGKFFGGYVTFDESGIAEAVQTGLRIEIGGPGTDYILWAGSGLTGAGDIPNPENPELDSKPIFYIDNFGNAVFRGTVEAEFVSGEVSRTGPIIENRTWNLQRVTKAEVENWGNARNMPPERWTHFGEWELPGPVFDTGHYPHFEAVMSVYGVGASQAVFRLQYQHAPINQENWIDATYTIFDISNFGGQRQITYVLPEKRTQGKTYFRLSGCGWYGSRVTGTDYGAIVSNIRGLIMGIR